MIYFTSDTHFGHKNIIEYCKRPFTSVDEMTEGMIHMWNQATNEDDVYFLGDFAFMGSKQTKEVFDRLKGRKHLIRGNHDNGNTTKLGWTSVQDMLEIRPKIVVQGDDGEDVEHKIHIVMCHFPILSWNNMAHGSVQLHGHCHGTLHNDKGLRMDVGVDPNNFYLLTLQMILNKLVMRTVVPTDYHGKDKR